MLLENGSLAITGLSGVRDFLIKDHAAVSTEKLQAGSLLQLRDVIEDLYRRAKK